MKIKEIMAVDPETLGPDETVEAAARLMRDADVGAAPVTSAGMVLGVLTDRDIVLRAVAEGLDSRTTKVADILTPGAIHCFEDDDVEEAAKLMADHQIRRIMVVRRDNRLAGVLSLADIVDTDRSGAAEVLVEVSRPAPLAGRPAFAPAPEAETSMRGPGVSETGEHPSRRSPVDALARAELSAIETYKQAIAKVGGEPVAAELRRIELEHEEALGLLVENVRRGGGAPPASSGIRGAWWKAVEAAALVLGRKAAIRTLKEGEQHGLQDYEAALADEALDPEVKALIRTKLLPQAKGHIPALDRVLAAV